MRLVWVLIMIDESGQSSGFGIVTQTDTIKKVANAILDAGEGCQSGLVYVDPVGAAKAATAALSTDAEPVGFFELTPMNGFQQVSKRNVTEPGVIPLYASPPTPSVDAKALEDRICDMADMFIDADDRSGFRLNVQSALSAQVQDVAAQEVLFTEMKIEDLISNYSNEFFDRRCDEILHLITDYHREALAHYFYAFAKALLLPWPDYGDGRVFDIEFFRREHADGAAAAPAAKLEEKP
jgi:hypothetical protein